MRDVSFFNENDACRMTCCYVRRLVAVCSESAAARRAARASRARRLAFAHHLRTLRVSVSLRPLPQTSLCVCVCAVSTCNEATRYSGFNRVRLDARVDVAESLRRQAATFVARYGGVYEKSAWIAEQAYVEQPTLETASKATLIAALADVVRRASPARQLALIRSHPVRCTSVPRCRSDAAGLCVHVCVQVLAKRAQLVEKSLTKESLEEQSLAALDQCSKDEFDKFQSLNTQYEAKVCVY
jgi:2-oxo-4-hydroxy-4-carboxy--5-ureidoimidazoline (OHCU) decarboxylase